MSLSIKHALSLALKIDLSKSDFEDYRLRVKNVFSVIAFTQASEVPIVREMPPLEPDSPLPKEPLDKSRKESMKKPQGKGDVKRKDVEKLKG
eukprot:654950-Amorphochlora_amoeboformis.AAC.1